MLQYHLMITDSISYFFAINYIIFKLIDGQTVSSLTPTFWDHNDEFNARIESLGFERREDTPADGNCAIWAILDQYNLRTPPDETFFQREEVLFARQLVVMEIRKSVVQGRADPGFFGGDPALYCEKMKKSGEYVDNIFLSYFAEYIGCDLILIHANPTTAANGVYTLIYGGGVGSERHGPNCPIFLGFFEPSVYGENGGHYQSIVPVRNNDVLKSVLDDGGFDVAGYLNFETVDEDEVTLEETSTSTFQPSSSSTISSKRTRSPESCEHLRSKFRRCGENWERIVRDVSISPPPPVSPATPVKITLPSFPSNDVRFHFKMLAACLLYLSGSGSLLVSNTIRPAGRHKEEFCASERERPRERKTTKE